MTDPPSSKARNNRSAFKDYLWIFGIALFIGIVGVALNNLFGEACVTETSLRDQVSEAVLRDRKKEYRRELLLYVWGFGLALVLTVVPFGLVYWSTMSPFALFVAIGAFAFVQIVIHFRCFLHIDPPRQNMDDLHLILFSSLLLLFMIGGTIWIMANLGMRMH